MRSIRQQLLIGLFYAALGSTLLAGFVLYKALREEANELADQHLRQVASGLPAVLTAAADLHHLGDPEERFYVQAWDANGALVHATREARQLPRAEVAGFSTLRIAGHGWRLYGLSRADGYVQVSQPNAVREELAGGMVLRVMLPMLAFVPLLGGLIYFIVGRALRPLDRLAQAVAGRSASALQPLTVERLSPELQPIVEALNALLGKIEHAMLAQRDFVADAAHELRSPLTALKLQLQLAERASGEAQRSAAYAKLHERLDRASHLVRQLLTLARHESHDAERTAARWRPVDLHLLAQQVVGDHSAYADSKGIDLGVGQGAAAGADAAGNLGVEPAGTAGADPGGNGGADSVAHPGAHPGADGSAHAVAPLIINGDAEGLTVLLSNLVDNALRYTQAGGRVDVLAVVDGGAVCLRVSDNGPGVPAASRGRLFDRFYRPDGNQVWGCGLGLSIVKNVADAHRADIALADAGPHGGLQVTVRFAA